MKKQTLIIIAVALIGFAGWSFLQNTQGENSMTPEEFKKRLETDTTVVLLDVRTPQEYHSRTGHIAGSILLPVQELQSRMNELEPVKGRPLLVYCRTQNRSAAAVQMLREQGFDAYFMVGGISQWNTNQYPVVYSE